MDAVATAQWGIESEGDPRPARRPRDPWPSSRVRLRPSGASGADDQASPETFRIRIIALRQGRPVQFRTVLARADGTDGQTTGRAGNHWEARRGGVVTSSGS